MANPYTGEQIDDVLSAASWIAEVVVEDRDDATRSTAPPTAFTPSPSSLLHRVVEAERDSSD